MTEIVFSFPDRASADQARAAIGAARKLPPGKYGCWLVEMKDGTFRVIANIDATLAKTALSKATVVLDGSRADAQRLSDWYEAEKTAGAIKVVADDTAIRSKS